MIETIAFPIRKSAILAKYKEGDNFNHMNTFSISRIARKLHFVPKFEPDTVIGQKGALCKDLRAYSDFQRDR